MDYLILIIAVCCFAAQFAFNNVYEGSIKQTVITALTLPLVIGTVGTVQYLLISGFSIEITEGSLWLAIFMAATFIPCYALGIKVLEIGSLAIYSMFMMLGGMLLPYFYGIIFLNEAVTLPRAVGSILLATFIVLQSLIQNAAMSKEEKKPLKDRLLFLALCIAIFFLNGMTGVIAKMHEMSAEAISEANFTFLYSAFTALISLLLIVIVFMGGGAKEKLAQVGTAMKPKPMLSMVGLGLMTNSGNFLLLKAAANLPASVQFPFTSGGVILLSTLVSAFIFKDKISKKEWLTVLGASVATVLFLF